jgi:hypothetical protein
MRAKFLVQSPFKMATELTLIMPEKNDCKNTFENASIENVRINAVK